VVSLGAGVIDGIRLLADDGTLIVSHWEGQLYIISPDGSVVEIADTIGEHNMADFEYIREQNLLIVPTFLGNKVVAYRID